MAGAQMGKHEKRLLAYKRKPDFTTSIEQLLTKERGGPISNRVKHPSNCIILMCRRIRNRTYPRHRQPIWTIIRLFQ